MLKVFTMNSLEYMKGEVTKDVTRHENDNDSRVMDIDKLLARRVK